MARTRSRQRLPPARRALHQSRQHLEDDKGDERAERAAVQDLQPRVDAGLHPRLCDEQGHHEASDEIRNLWWSSATYVAAIQPANAMPEWPEGRPPRSGVPLRVNAFVVMTTRMTRTSATSVISAGASRTRSSTRAVRCATACAKTR